MTPVTFISAFLEEAWIVQALVREDGLSQLQVAELLGRHKSWVCRRLALLERLSEECREDLRLGLLSPTMARQLTRLPAGNQAEVVAAVRREHLTAAVRRRLPFPFSGNCFSPVLSVGMAARETLQRSRADAGAEPRFAQPIDYPT